MWRSLLLGAGSFLIYGLWAAGVNAEHGTQIALVALLTQGTVSFCTTFSVTSGMEQLHRRFGHRWSGVCLTASLPPTLVLIFMSFVHWLTGTPDILETIAPSALVGIVYCGVYTWGLHVARSRTVAVTSPDPVGVRLEYSSSR